MTTQAVESAAMAHRAGGFIQAEFAGSMGVQQVRGMVGGLELGDVVLTVTILATERVIDLIMTNQTIRHLRQCRMRDLVRFLQASMAALAGVGGIEVSADVARRLKIVLPVDGGGDHRRHVGHFQMLGVAEFGNAHRGRRGDLDLGLLVAPEAYLFGRQQIVLDLGAGGSCVTAGAFQLHLEMQAMRKRRGG